LKNRPFISIFDIISTPISESTFNKIKEYIDTIEAWFEGLQQELKDILKEEVYGDQVYYRICDSCVMRNLECEALQKLKEILGEEEK